MFEACLLCTAALAARAAWLRLGLAGGHRLVWTRRAGWLQTQLWRRTLLHRQPDGMGGLGLPLPRETRTRLTSVAGLPLWREVESVGLPIDRADRIDEVAELDFDRAFSAAFQIRRAGARAARATATLAPSSRL